MMRRKMIEYNEDNLHGSVAIINITNHVKKLFYFI
jgi:hypothetical protein